MKESVRFSLIYSGFSFLLLLLMRLFFKSLSPEIFSYAIWLFIFYSILNLIAFVVLGFFIDKYKLSFAIRIFWYALLCILVLNSIPFFEERKILTLEVFRSLSQDKGDSIGIVIHVIAALSFSITYWLFLRKYKSKVIA